MNSQILGLRVASIIFGLMSLAQLLRLVIQPEACCWTPDAALAERARLADIGWPEYMPMEALPSCAATRVVAPASQSGLGYLE